MAELAHANGICFVFASVLLASRFPSRPEPPNSTGTFLAMNGWIKDCAAKHG
jgi:hypothetical protein